MLQYTSKMETEEAYRLKVTTDALKLDLHNNFSRLHAGKWLIFRLAFIGHGNELCKIKARANLALLQKVRTGSQASGSFDSAV